MSFRIRGIALGFITVASLLVTAPAGAAGATTNWSTSLPTSGDVVVPAGSDVVLDTNLNLNHLVIDGTVRCGSRSVRISARRIEVNGQFLCGTKKRPFKKRLTITLTGPGTGSFGGYGDKYFVVTEGAELALFGPKRRTWTTLAAPARPGDTTITVARPVGRPGDSLVLAPTNYLPEQAEVVTIASRDGNVIQLTEPLREEHWCGIDTYNAKKLTECAEVGLLTHRITIQGDTASANTQIGGHMMFLRGSKVHLRGIELRRMGQKAKLARYPIHWHMAGQADGSISNSSVWQSYNRFVTVHGSHGVLVRQVVGHDTIGHGFYLEDGIETGNRFLCNLAVLTRPAQKGEALVPSDRDASGFWISNPDNVYRRNHAAGTDFAGFWMAFPDNPRGLSATSDVHPRRTPLRAFADNTAHTVGFAGLYVDGGERSDRSTGTTWYEPRQNPADESSPQVTPTIQNFTAWKSQNYGIWLRTKAGVVIDGAKLADNFRGVYLANVPKNPRHDLQGIVRNSLIVGTSSNHGTPESWEEVDVNGHMVPMHWETDAPITGVSMYDGPMRVENTLFADFVSNATREAGAIGTQAPNPFSISSKNAVKGLTFLRANRVLFPDLGEGRQGDAGTVFVDEDGSVSGVAGAGVVVTDSLLDGSDCTIKNDWNAAVCDESYGRVFVTREDGAHLKMSVTRDDGRTVYLEAEEGWRDSIALVVRTDKFYVLDPEGTNPGEWSFWAGVEIPAGEGIVVAVPAPSGSWEVELWGSNRGQVNSKAALASGSAGWFFESSTGLIYLRFTTAAQGGWVG